MKRILFVALAVMMFVACAKDTGAAEKQMTEYKAEWCNITSLLNVEAVEAEGFDAWYNTLTNSEVRDLYAAVDELSLSYDKAEHWYKSLSDAEQKAVRVVAEAWEVENPASQLQIELFVESLMGDDMPLLKVYIPAVEEVEEQPEVATDAPEAEEVVADEAVVVEE